MSECYGMPIISAQQSCLKSHGGTCLAVQQLRLRPSIAGSTVPSLGRELKSHKAHGGVAGVGESQTTDILKKLLQYVKEVFSDKGISSLLLSSSDASLFIFPTL